MILVLAVSGSLVKNDLSTPARPLLVSIRQQKASYPEQKKVVKPQPVLSEHEIKAPLNWEKCRLGDLVLTITGGGTPSKSNPTYWGGEIPWASVKDLKENKYLERTDDSITQAGLENSASNLIPSGRIIVCTRMGLGKINITKIATAINQDLKALELPTEVNPDFFFILYKTRNILGKGTTVSGITQDKLLALPAVLPPLEEQERIVVKVDELMALCDKLEDQQQKRTKLCELNAVVTLNALEKSATSCDLHHAWQRIYQNILYMFDNTDSLQQLKQTLLQLALMGKLTSRNPSFNPASDLINTIREEKKQLVKTHKLKFDKNTHEIDEKEIPFPLPDGWEWKRLSDLLAVVTDGDHQPPPKSISGIPFLVIGNLNKGKVTFDGCRFVSEEYYNNLDWSRKPTLNDILYTVTGSFGIPIVINSAQKFCVQRHIAILKSVASTPVSYLKYVLSSKYALDYASNIATGIAQKTVPLTGLRRMPIPIPPAKEQEQIVTLANHLIALCDLLEGKVVKAKSTASTLATVLTAAITGIRTEDKEKMKAPKTELVSKLRIGVSPTTKDQAPLASILLKHKGELSAKALWQYSGMEEIDAFYRQLKLEMAKGWIVQPEPAYMKELEGS
ncbi:MAG TPA: restriction endonuclease subunit S [Geobacteraceae bacterium]|nr:restriction endonuclease subunit S [Geobacteraceae bacterium]